MTVSSIQRAVCRKLPLFSESTCRYTLVPHTHSHTHTHTLTHTHTQLYSYPAEKTQYTADMLRAFNVLIETSDIKAPGSELGDSEEVLLGSGSSHDGHVARNLRICLAMADLVQP